MVVDGFKFLIWILLDCRVIGIWLGLFNLTEEDEAYVLYGAGSRNLQPRTTADEARPRYAWPFGLYELSKLIANYSESVRISIPCPTAFRKV